MTDPLSAAGSIAGLVAIADVVFSRTFRYAKAVKVAAKDIEKLASEIGSLSGVLHSLSLVASELEGRTVDPNLRLHHINSCRETLTKIQRKLERNDPTKAKDHLLEAALRSLKWPFSSSETKELLAEVGRHKATIGIALSADNMAALLRALSRQDELADDIQDIKSKLEARWAVETRIALDKERQEILHFFEKTDPFSNHETSLKLRHPLTGLWLTEGQTFKTWLHTRNSKLWLSGIPGAGKTVLAASVIEETINESSPNRAVAYFYCDYKDERTQDPVNILGSLATQLAKQSERCFALLQQYYVTCHHKDKAFPKLELPALSKKIGEMASSFDDVSIIVDALDECGKNTIKVVESLISLGSDINSNTRTLFLSRNEVEIRQLLQEHYNHIEIAAKSEDLRLYVAAETEIRMRKIGREQLRIKSPELKMHIMETLVERADGMFRWVACQMDYLCSLPTDAARRKALKSLPPDLNKTYERILERVNESDRTIQRLVQKTLQWIVCSSLPLTITALCEAVAIEEGDEILNTESICEGDEILLHCSSLIRRAAGGNYLELAHFTVKEFLNGIDPNPSCPFAFYSLRKDAVYCQLARTCLTYLNLRDFQRDLPENWETWKKHDHQYPFRRRAAMMWFEYASQSWHDPSLLALAKDLFKPSRTFNFLSWARDLVWLQIEEFHYRQASLALMFHTITTSVCSGNVTPLHIAAALGSAKLCEWLLESGANASQMSKLGNPLHCALLGDYALRPHQLDSQLSRDTFSYGFQGKRDVFQMLIDAQADCKSPYKNLYGKTLSVLELALYVDFEAGLEHPISILSSAGAPVDQQFLAAMEVLVRKKGEGWARGVIDALRGSTVASGLKDELLKRALAVKSSTALHLLRDKDDVSDLMPIANLEELFHRAVRFDQKEVMEELLLDVRLDMNSKSSRFSGTALHEAADNNSFNAMELLLSLHADVCARDLEGKTPLHRTAHNMEDRCISLLLDYGAVADAVDDEGCSIWHLAAGAGNVEALSVLLERVENNDAALTLPSKKGLAPISYAARARSPAALMLLLSESNHVPQPPDGLSLAHGAVQRNSVEVLRMLIEKQVQLGGRTKDGSTALHFIPKGAKPDLVRLLTAAGVESTSITNEGYTPLHVLLRDCVSVDIEVFELLATTDCVNMVTKDGFTALHYAVNIPNSVGRFLPLHKREEYVKTLAAKDADFAARDPSGRSSLHVLLDQFEEASLRNYLDGLYDVITYTMRRITDLDLLQEMTAGGYRPLNWAVTEGNEPLVKDLVAKGVSIDLRDTAVQWSGLDYACFYGCSKELFQYLLRNSNQLHEPNGDGDYLPHVICGQASKADSSLLTALFDAGVNLDSRSDSRGQTPLMIAASCGKLDHLQVLLKNNVNLRTRDIDGWEAVHHAAWHGHVPILRSLEGLDIDWSRGVSYSHKNRDFTKCNVLHIAAFDEHNPTLRYIAEKCLIPDINCRNGDGESPLHLAVIHGNHETVEILISYGANIDAENKFGQCAIHYAVEFWNIPVARALLQHGCSLAADARGLTPELAALKRGYTELASMFRERRLQQGKRSEQSCSQPCGQAETIPHPNSSRTLALAIQLGDLEICSSLVESGVNFEGGIDGCGGCTPVLAALNSGHNEIARYLIRKGAPTTGQICDKHTNRGYSALHLASQQDSQTDILQFLLSKDLQSEIPWNQSPVHPIHVAVTSGNNTGLRVLLQHIQSQTRASKPTETSASTTNASDMIENGPRCWEDISIFCSEIPSRDRRQQQVVSCILDAQIDETNLQWSWLLKGVSPQANLTTEHFRTGTALHMAAWWNNLPAAKLLLEYGADVNCPDRYFRTPLHLACSLGHTSLTDLLLRSGSNPNAQDNSSKTPAMLAAAIGHVATLERLRHHRADFSICDDFGKSILYYATCGGAEVFSYLLTLGCNPYTRDRSDLTPLLRASNRCYQYPALTALICNSDLDFTHSTILYGGILRNQVICSRLSTLRVFLSRIPKRTKYRDLNHGDGILPSPLYVAAIEGAVMVLSLLLREGADLEVEGGHEGTALMGACAAGRLPSVKHLVRAGAKISYIKDDKLFTAIHAARYFPSVIRWLLVGRYTEQFKIDLTPAELTKHHPISNWSGPTTVEVPTVGLCSPLHGESSFERIVRLHKLRKELAGKVVRL